MIRTRLLVSLMVGAFAVGCSGSGTPPPADGPSAEDQATAPMMIQAPPVYALIGHGERIGLTSEQIVAIDSIGEWLQTANNSHMAELRRGMRSGGGLQRVGPGRMSDEQRQLLEQIDENNRAAVAGVRDLLTEEQQQKVCEAFAPRPGEDAPRLRRGGGGMGGGGGGRVIRRPGGASPEGRMAGSGGRMAWDWCAQPAGDEARG